MDKEETKPGEGLIPKLIKNLAWRRKFTKEERKELDQIRKGSFMRKMREKAKFEGEKMAEEELKENE